MTEVVELGFVDPHVSAVFSLEEAGEAIAAVGTGHGNPMNALEVDRYTSAWRAFGEAVPRPRAILVVSAHRYIDATAVTAMPDPRTVHEFYGFPLELLEEDYRYARRGSGRSARRRLRSSTQWNLPTRRRPPRRLGYGTCRDRQRPLHSHL